jgi:hypothetical protein
MLIRVQRGGAKASLAGGALALLVCAGAALSSAGSAAAAPQPPTTVVAFNQSAVDTAAYKWVTTSCPADHPYVDSGGYIYGNQAVLTNVEVRQNLPTQNGSPVLTTPGKEAPAGNGWSVLAVTSNGGPANAVWRLDVWATCSTI